MVKILFALALLLTVLPTYSQESASSQSLQGRITALEKRIQDLETRLTSQASDKSGLNSILLYNPETKVTYKIWIDKNGYLVFTKGDSSQVLLNKNMLVFQDGEKIVDLLSFGEGSFDSCVPSRMEWELLKWTTNHSGSLYLSRKLIQQHISTYYSFPV